MKKTTLSLLLAVAVYSGFARPVCGNSPKTPGRDTVSAESNSFSQMLSEIMNVSGLQPNFEIKEANVKNIEAVLSHKKRYILYNPEFISWINKATKSKWAVRALLAHEIGHHLNGHTLRKTGSLPQLELEADEFAGFVLYKLGATVEEAQEVINYIARPEISKTHPAKASRMLAIQQGWNNAATTEMNSTSAKKIPVIYPVSKISN